MAAELKFKNKIVLQFDEKNIKVLSSLLSS